jgi:hypothetical protein
LKKNLVDFDFHSQGTVCGVLSVPESVAVKTILRRETADMIKLGKWIVVIIIAFGIPGFAQAEFYKYIDKNGNVQFTDNFANIPADQRGKIHEYEELPPRPKVPKASEGTEKGEEAGEGKDQEKALDEEIEHEIAGVGLDKKGDQLRGEYEVLMEERAKLDEEASKRLTPMARKRLLKKIQNFNERMEDFEKRREAHNKVVEVHNAQVEKDAQVAPEESPAN